MGVQTSALPLCEMLTPDTVAELNEMFPGSPIINLFFGGMNVSKYSMGNITNNSGAMSIGDGGNATYTNNSTNDLEGITKILIELIKQNQDMPDDTRKELSEAVSAVTDQAKSENPNKTIVGSLMGSIDKIISVVSKTPELIAAFEKWKAFIVPLFGG